ncbi:hypothetical protein Y032_0002g1148 [Ancylostoma ceylanicum]|uniref:Peptidase M20 dimerisation domain-containing protein n=1 Tax=Ancylostoma ceylanicum TaxID=53326 RepID=A0A016W0S7_9BILA|nr:hypothetical protein Y032_0002g1148 [Ancylostoma ceylanicum]
MYGCHFQQSIINSALTFREEQRLLLKNDPSKKLGDVITLNLTKVEGGVQVNVLPEKFTICEFVALPENSLTRSRPRARSILHRSCTVHLVSYLCEKSTSS